VSAERVYWHDVIGYNYRMTNIEAAIGLAQLERADQTIAKKREIAAWYAEDLSNLPLVFHREVAGTRHSYWMCSILANEAEDRDALREYLRDAGIETRPTFWPSHMLPMYGNGTAAEFPVASSLGLRGINLPSYPELSRSDVKTISSAIADFFHQRKAP
jgi:perosamine synthetase